MDHGVGRSGSTRPRVWFLGDLDDPWVVALADALPPPWPSRRVHCPSDLPHDPFGPLGPADVLVIHRAVLTNHDAERISEWRSRANPPPRVILCHGPHARGTDLDRWSELVDVTLPEATAFASLARRLGLPAGRDRRAESIAQGVRPRVAVVSGHFAIRRMLVEAVEAAGYPVAEARDWSEAPAGGPAVWEVPALEPGWPEELARRSRLGPVITLIGFADRELVRIARSQGAAACLELPFDLDDLMEALARVAAPRPRMEPAHPTPPPPASWRRAERPARLVEPPRES
ncbi:MAG: hypothetical protein AB7I30_08630 [Isosphaeraceae bacterium]